MMSYLLRATLIGLLLPLGLSLGTPLAQAEEHQGMTLSAAINIAGRQRMLSQRIVKTYAQLLLELEYRKSSSQLDAAVALYDQQLNELEAAYGDNQQVRDSLVKARALWEPLKTAVQQPLAKDRLEELALLDEKVLNASHQVVLDLEAMSPDQMGYLVNIAGRQRMISQRIAKFYMLRALGLEDEPTAEGLQTAAAEFRIALAELVHAKATPPEVQVALEDAKREWSVFEAAFDLKGEYAPFMISRYSEKLLQSMDEITGMYAALPSH